MFLKKYEIFLQQLNTQISNGEFDVQENKQKLEKIIAIYKSLQAKDYQKAKELIGELWFVEEEQKVRKKSNIPGWAFPPPAPAPVVMKSASIPEWFWWGVSKSIKSFFSFWENKSTMPDTLKKEQDESELSLEGACETECDSFWWAIEEVASNYRDWNIETVHDEDNIEAFNSIEMMSAIFLKNLQEKIWTQK